MQGIRVAVVGATGLVGGHLLEILAQSSLPLAEVKPLASKRSVGRVVTFREKPLTVQPAEPQALAGMDVVFMAAGGKVSQELAPAAVQQGAVVIDKSSAFRMDPRVPLVVPEINGSALAGHQGIIASPNCTTSQLVMALAPLHQAAGLRRVIVSTYQSVSGSGIEAMHTLHNQTNRRLAADEEGEGDDDLDLGPYPVPIAFNVIPQCDDFADGGYTKEEWKIMAETRKILGLPHLAITATAVRVPVMVGHSEAVLVELERPLSEEDARRALEAMPGVVVMDRREPGGYPTALTAAGRDEVFAGRIRRDPSVPNGLWLWIVSDNLRKGAATNAVQIAEALFARGMLRAG